MHLRAIVLILASLFGPVALAQVTPPLNQTHADLIGRMLDDWHDAAAKADEPRYFEHFLPDAVFMGTDVKERWTAKEFREWAQPFFKRGRAWSFTAHDRHIDLSSDAQTGWFDELLDTPNLGTARGSGVARFTGEKWKIAQYNLSVPIPNEIVDKVVKMIREPRPEPVPAPHPDDPVLDLSIMTFNIGRPDPGDAENRWENRRDVVADVIRRGQYDIVGLQSALRPQLNDLERSLPEFSQSGVGRDDGKEFGEYAAILYRTERFRVLEEGTFWFSDTPEIPGSRSWGENAARVCTWVHLVERRAHHGEPRSFYAYNINFDQESPASRQKSVDLLLDRIAARTARDPVIVTGDFGAGEDSTAIAGMMGKDERAPGQSRPHRPVFVDSFRMANPGGGAAGTIHDFHGAPLADGTKVDFILVAPPTVVRSAAIIRDSRHGRYPSDHFPVDAHIGLRAEIPD